jgi:hypothetical protein
MPPNQSADTELPQGTLFGLPTEAADRPPPKPAGPPAKPRVQRAQRDQMEWLPMVLNDLIPEDHEARSVWEFVGKMDLSPL